MSLNRKGSMMKHLKSSPLGLEKAATPSTPEVQKHCKLDRMQKTQNVEKKKVKPEALGYSCVDCGYWVLTERGVATHWGINHGGENIVQ